MKRRRPLSAATDLLLLAALSAAPALTAAPGAVLLGVATGLWALQVGRPRERRVGALTFGLGAVLLTVAALSAWRPATPPSPVDLERSHARWWAELDGAARTAAQTLGADLESAARREVLFERLQAIGAGGRGRIARTLLLVDRDGEAVAWGGPGLLHDLRPEEMTAPGRGLRQSATAATLFTSVPVEARRGWHLVAGASFARDGAPPLADPALATRAPGGWHLVVGEGEGAPTKLVVGAGDGPAAEGGAWQGVATGLVALGLLWIAALRAVGRALLSGTVLPPRQPVASVLVPAALAALLTVHALGANASEQGGLALALTTALVGIEIGRRRWAGRLVPVATLLGLLMPVALALALRSLADPLAPWSEARFGDGSALAGRLALLLAIFAPVAVAAGGAASRRGGRWGWTAAALALLGGALAGRPIVALVVLAAAGLAATRMASGARLGLNLSTAAALLVSGLIGGGAGAAGEQLAIERALPRQARHLMPPSPAELVGVAAAMDEALARHDPARFLPADGSVTGRGDLAFAIWRDSPLARVDLLSALVVEFEDGGRSTFSYGLPIDAAGDLVSAPERWSDLEEQSWPERRIGGVIERTIPAVGAAGDEFGAVRQLRWWAVPRVGFGAGATWTPDLESTLLRGLTLGARPFGLAPQVRYVVRGAEGSWRASSWLEGTPPVERWPAPGTIGEVLTPDGTARAAAETGGSLRVAVFLPRPGPGAALERTGSVAAAPLLALLALLALGWLLALPRSAVRDLLRRATRSYSKRLVIVFAALLLLPVGAFYFFLSRTLERRIVRAQEDAARAALGSAQRVLGEYVLTLQPGFGVGTAIDDVLLEWLSRVVRHDVHLYWGSEIYASSKRDLFAAGLLPRRLPGDVQARLELGGDRLARRTGQVGAAEYLELYTPLAVPGEVEADDGSATRLVLSMPLLAQQEEAVAEAARLRRRALLASLALLVALAATGARAARRFTRPIEELVAGTRRIAAGAPTLGVRPGDAELEALSEAIDRMAARIAAGRERLLAEKRLVERIVESVAGAIVALDAAGRVLIINRSGRDLLAVEPGDDLIARLRAQVDDPVQPRPELRAVAEFADTTAADPARHAVHLSDATAEDRDWTLVRVPLEEAGEAAVLLVVEDVTDVVRARRLEAWAEMARLIAHEIKNPLTPIRLSAEHLREAWQRDRAHFESVFERCTRNILTQVEELRQIASEFSTYSQIPRLERQAGDLSAAVGAVAEAYRASPPPGVEVRLDLPAESLPADFDPRLLPRAIRNLIENAVRAVAGGGTVEVRVAREGQMATVTVSDDGPGVPPDQVGRVLEPYFSTHATGTGLGLPIAARIAEEHGGSLVARNRTGGGFEVVVTIPLQ